MSRISLSHTGQVAHPHQKQSIQEWVRTHAALGQRVISIDLAGVPSPTSNVLVALSLAARQAAELALPVVLINANQRVRMAVSQLGIEALGMSFADGSDRLPTVAPG